MNKRARLNYIHAMSTQVEHKKMYKAKKQWVVAGLSFLVATGLGVVGGQLTTHAASTNISQQTTTSAAPKVASGSSNVSNQKSTNSSVSSSANSNVKQPALSNDIQYRAEALHSQVVTNGMNALNKIKNTPVNSSGSSDVNNSASGNQTTPVSAPSAKSGVSASASSNVKHGFGAMRLNAQVPKTTQQASDGHWIYNNGNYISDKQAGQWKTSQSKYYGLNWKYNEANKAVEFTGGTPNSNLSDFIINSNNDIKNASSIKFDSDIYTNKVTNMTHMFHGAHSLKSLYLSKNFTAPNVNSMGGMFESDYALSDLNLSNFNTSNNLSYTWWMFANDKNLKSLTLSNSFDTGNVKDMNHMFINDYDLQSLTLPDSFNTSQVKDMNNMFASDGKLQTLNLPHNIDMSSATNTSGMFINDGSLTNLNLSSLKTSSQLTDTHWMFRNDTGLQSLTLGNSFDTSQVTNMSDMFANDKNLQSLTVPDSFNTSQVKDMHYMFADDWNLKSLVLPSTFDTSQVTNMASMFQNDSNLTSLTLPDSFNTQNVTTMNHMFVGEHSLTQLNLGNSFNTSKVSDMTSMFSDEYVLPSLNLGNQFNTSRVTYMPHIFDSDYALTNLNLGNQFNTSGTVDMYMMFIRDGQNTSNGISIDLGPNFNTSKAIMNNDANNYGTLHNGISDMFQYAKINSLTIPQGAIFKFNNKTGLQPLYQKDSNDNYTSAIPVDFTRSNHVGVFESKNVKPITYQYSDIYHSVDGMSAPKASTGTTAPTTAPNNWQFVDENGKVSNKAVMKNGKVLVAPSYKGLTYKFDKTNNSVEFVSGTASDNLGGFVPTSPKNIHNATSMSFSKNINTSNVVDTVGAFANTSLQSLNLTNFNTNNVKDMEYMFDTNPKLQSLNLSNSFNTSNVTNMNSMFANDFTLQSLILPSTFNTSNVTNMNAMFDDDYALTSLLLPNTFNTSNVTNMNSMFANEPNLISLNLPDSFNPYNVTDMGYMFTADHSLTALNLGNGFNTHNVTNMQSMFSDDWALHSINLGNKFDTSNVSNMEHMFDSDYNLHTLVLPSVFTTEDASDMYMMFINDGKSDKTGGVNLTLSPNFDTSKAMNNNSAQTDQGTHNGISDMFQYAKINSITMPSTAKFNAKSQLGSNWYQVGSKNNQLEKDGNGNYITVPNASKTNLMDSNSHTGTWVKNPNPQKVTNTIAFTDNKTSDLVGSTTANGALDSSYTIPNDQAPKGYSFVGNDNKITITDPSKKVTVKVSKNSNKTDNADKDVPVAPNPASADVQYQYNGKTIVSSDTTDYKGNDSQATDAGNNSTNISAKNEKGIPAGWHLANKSTNVPYDNGKHKVAIEPNTNTANVHYQYKGKTINSHKFSGNDSRATQAGNNSVNVTPTNEPDIPAGYHLANKSDSFAYNGGSDNVAILPNHVSDTIDYQLNGKTIGSHSFGGNDIQATSAKYSSNNNPVNVSDTTLIINSNKEATGLPVGYQLKPNSNNKVNNNFEFDGKSHNVAVEPTNQTATVNYVDKNGNIVGHTIINGNTGSSVTPQSDTTGYHATGKVNPYTFDPANAGNNPSDNITVAPNTLNGTALIHIYYKVGNTPSDTIDGGTQQVPLNNIQYGQSDVVSSTQYCPTDDGYRDNNSNWSIPVDSLIASGSQNYGLNAQGQQPITALNHTFTYDATEAPDLVIRYDIVTDNANHNDPTVKPDITSDTYTPSDLGIKPQDWVIGNTITLHDGNQGTKKDQGTNVIHAPSGYHLVEQANGYDYQNGSETITLETTTINTNKGKQSVVLMSMPMITGNKAPNSQSNNNPAKPASNASGSTSNAASISMNSTELSSLAKEIGEDINVTVRPNVTNTTNTIDDTTLNSLASEVATNNQEISSLANKPTNTTSTTNVNYSYFDNLINNGVDKLTNAINKDFKANLHNVHAQRTHKVTVKRVRKHIKWIMIMKPVKLYNKATLVGTKSGVKTLKPNHEITLNVKDVYKVHNHYIFKINFRHHDYFITANHNYVRNSYLPLNHNIINRKVRVLNDVYGYRHKNYDKVKTYHKGFVGRVKNIVRLGHYNMTRIQLTNGLWISANKNFIKLV